MNVQERKNLNMCAISANKFSNAKKNQAYILYHTIVVQLIKCIIMRERVLGEISKFLYKFGTWKDY